MKQSNSIKKGNNRMNTKKMNKNNLIFKSPKIMKTKNSKRIIESL